MKCSSIKKNLSGFLQISILVLFVVFNLMTLVGASSLQVENFPLLRRDSEGSQVDKLQRELSMAGFKISDETGYFGLQTEIAVEQFQRHQNLAVDGLAGEETLSTLKLIQDDKVVPTQEVEAVSWSEVDEIFNRTDSVIVTDIASGLSLRVSRIYGTNHADVEPVNAENAEVLRKIYGGEWSWERRPVVVQIQDRLLAASITGMPHGENVNGHISDNNFTGHFDIHFQGSRRHKDNAEDEQHQNMIKKAAEQEWPLFKSQ